METQQDDFGLDFSVYQKKKRTKCYKWISISWAEKKKQVFHSNESYCRQTHYLHILIFILYFFSDDKVTVYKNIFQSIDVRSPCYGHTWNYLYFELVTFYSLNYSPTIHYGHEPFCGRHVDDIVAPLRPNQNDIRPHPH